MMGEETFQDRVHKRAGVGCRKKCCTFTYLRSDRENPIVSLECFACMPGRGMLMRDVNILYEEVNCWVFSI